MFNLNFSWKLILYFFITIFLCSIIFYIYTNTSGNVPTGNVPTGNVPTGNVPTGITDEQILNTYYSGIKTHSGFYSEVKGADNYFSKYDPKNPYKSPVYCGNNIEEAKTIAYPIILSGSQFYKKIHNEFGTEKYFQFETQYNDNGEVVIFRIDNCNYIERVSRFGTGEIGIFKKIPLSQDSVKELSEYLWFERNYTYGGLGTVSSRINEDSDNYYSEIYYVSGVGGDWGINDEISLIKRVTSINKETGIINLNETTLKTVSGKSN